MQFTAQTAEDAISLSWPFIHNLMTSYTIKRMHLHVVVAINVQTHVRSNDYDTLAEHSVGARSEWEHAYDVIAHGKTRISARTGLTSREVQLIQPELLTLNDVKFWGNAVIGDLIVSCSGVQPWWDEAISNVIAWTCKALANDTVERAREDDDAFF